MTIPNSDSRPEDLAGTILGPSKVVDMTLDQFRTALRRSPVARQHIGLDISDQAAATIAADEELSAAWFQLWRASVPTTPDPPVVTTPGLTFMRTARQSELASLRELPMRFNPPPGWSMPSPDWIVQHIGLGMADVWRPPGAPVDDPVGWQWWIAQEPAWSTWIEQEERSYRNGGLWTAGLFAVSVPVGLIPGAAGWAVIGVVASAFVGICTLVLLAHFRADPMAHFRDRYVDTLGTA